MLTESAAVGNKGANIVPSTAVAELDLRTTPGASASYLVGLIEKHIRAKGYHLSDGAPTDLTASLPAECAFKSAGRKVDGYDVSEWAVAPEAATKS